MLNSQCDIKYFCPKYVSPCGELLETHKENIIFGVLSIENISVVVFQVSTLCGHVHVFQLLGVGNFPHYLHEVFK